MRWEDEGYVRFYRRSTADWLSMSWQARGLFGLIMRELDRAGLLVLGTKTGLRALAMPLRATWVEIEAPLGELLADGCVRWDEARGVLWVPNFIEAQEANQSDAARKRESRARARDALRASSTLETVTKRDGAEKAVTKRDSAATSENDSLDPTDDVTKRDTIQSRNVTDFEGGVTRGHTRSLCAVPSVLNQPAPAGAHARVADSVPLTDEERTMLEEAERAARARGQSPSSSASVAGPTNFFEQLEGKEPKT